MNAETEKLNFLLARSTWLFFLTAIAQIAAAFGVDLSFDMATDPDKFADAVSAVAGVWAVIERVTGRMKLVKPWQDDASDTNRGARLTRPALGLRSVNEDKR